MAKSKRETGEKYKRKFHRDLSRLFEAGPRKYNCRSLTPRRDYERLVTLSA